MAQAGPLILGRQPGPCIRACRRGQSGGRWGRPDCGGETALCSSGTVRAEKPSQEGVGGASCRLEALAWPVVHHAALCR